LRGERPDDDDPLLDLAHTLANIDLSARSRRRLEFRRRFQLRPQSVLRRQDRIGWLPLVQASPASRLVASAVVVVLLSSFLTILSLPGRAAWPGAPGTATAASLSAAGSQRASLVPQPIPTPNAPYQQAVSAPALQTYSPTTDLSPTQIYTRLAPQQSTRLLPDNKP